VYILPSYYIPINSFFFEIFVAERNVGRWKEGERESKREKQQTLHFKCLTTTNRFEDIEKGSTKMMRTRTKIKITIPNI
jgi:hypothetical protein